VFVTRKLPAPGIQPLEDAGLSVAVHDSVRPLSASELAVGAAGARAVLAMVTDAIDAALLDGAADLRIVANLGVGFDNVDLEHAAARGIVVTNTPDVLADATADLTWALILSTARRVVEGDTLVRAGGWTGWTPTQLLGMELRGRTLGVLGLGAIGAAVARRAPGFGMEVVYHSRRPADTARDIGASYVSFGELLRRSDVLTLHAPLSASLRGVIGAPELAAMKRDAILINTSRGGLVDEGALIQALRERTIAGAGLDVFEREPSVPGALRDLPNTVLLPHLGSATTTARGRMAELACANVIAVLAGEPALTPVNKPMVTKGLR
jgi:glyoxylate reductase